MKIGSIKEFECGHPFIDRICKGELIKSMTIGGKYGWTMIRCEGRFYTLLRHGGKISVERIARAEKNLLLVRGNKFKYAFAWAGMDPKDIRSLNRS